MDEEIIIKTAVNDEDREKSRTLINRAFRERQHVSRKDRDTITFNETKETLLGDNKYLFMLLKNESNYLIGTALMNINRSKELGLYADIQFLAVTPENWGQNFGSKLLLHIENSGKIFSCNNSYLSIIYHPKHPQKNLVQWYLRQGYQFHEEFNINEQDKAKWFSPEYCSEITAHFYRKEI